MANNQNDRERFRIKYNLIGDMYRSIEEVGNALKAAGLERTNLIVGVDFTASNTSNGKYSFGGKSLHSLVGERNPYEEALSIIGTTLSGFDEDNYIPCFGFGDASTTDSRVFHFNRNGVPCNGFQEAVRRYRDILKSKIRLAGPTSFAPIVEAAVRIVEQSGGQHHLLLIIADGEVTRPSSTYDGELSGQERATVDAIVAASNYALSIVVVGVGDGPFDTMRNYDNNLPVRVFDNFQFVEFSSIMNQPIGDLQKQGRFAMETLMEVPFQYQAMRDSGILGRRLNRMPPHAPLDPPV